jgi:NADPH-dependent curcumin reductase CurA
MRQRVNRQVRLKSRPSAVPQAEHFEIVEAPVPDPSNGQVLVRNIYVSVDPAMRGWVSAVANYSEPVALGAVMRSLAVGRVEESRSSDFHPGEYVTGMFGWQDYAVVDAVAIERKVGGSGLPISTSLGVLGLNGLTAYFALLEIGQPKAGETAVVSTAGGELGGQGGPARRLISKRADDTEALPGAIAVCVVTAEIGDGSEGVYAPVGVTDGDVGSDLRDRRAWGDADAVSVVAERVAGDRNHGRT